MSEIVVVTGGAGFIGSHTVDALRDEGHTVIVLDKKPWAEAENLHHRQGEIEYVEGNISDAPLVDSLMKRVEKVVHLAALVSVPLSLEDPLGAHESNVTGTATIFDAAARHGIKKVVYASSAAVYGNTDQLPITETDTLQPASPYALHKLVNEQYAAYYTQHHHLPIVGFRYFNVYGSRQDPSSPYSGVISIFCDKMQKAETPTIFGDGTQTRDFIHVSDVVAANLRGLADQDPSHRVFNVGRGSETSLNELIELLATITKRPVTPEYAPERPGDIKRSVSSIEKIRTELAFAPTIPMEDGLRELL